MDRLIFGDERSIRYRQLFEGNDGLAFMCFQYGTPPDGQRCRNCVHLEAITASRYMNHCIKHREIVGRDVTFDRLGDACGLFTAPPEDGASTTTE